MSACPNTPVMQKVCKKNIFFINLVKTHGLRLDFIKLHIIPKYKTTFQLANTEFIRL